MKQYNLVYINRTYKLLRLLFKFLLSARLMEKLYVVADCDGQHQVAATQSYLDKLVGVHHDFLSVVIEDLFGTGDLDVWW